jgi:AraC family transcriptional regulator of adaptative response/methylated-DNA-[protein]-cysteine methyltransferase
MNDYERVATTIRYLDQHHNDQPDLIDLARGAGLSPFHFHRLFSAWAGVTPKDFLQCLTLEHVKMRLREGASVLSASLDAGLSGPGRIHDLCVTLEAASPGEMKSGGVGLKIAYGFSDSPFGDVLIGETGRGICHLAFVGENGRDGETEALHREWPAAKFHRTDARAKKLAADIFVRPGAGRPSRPLRAFVRGTPFQLQVWRALLRVPAGSLVSYGRLSQAIAQPGAARAVGSAVGANPLAFIIPCHRVIRETGVLGNYQWDPIRKRAMIGWEISSLSAFRAKAAPMLQADAA